MATNKNQHYVPRCYLRPFSIDGAGRAILLFNLDRKAFIRNAPVKHQCSKDYFYGQDTRLERVLQITETSYADLVRRIHRPGYSIGASDGTFLLRFWLLQHLRTDAAARKTVELSEMAVSSAQPLASQFRLTMAGAVRTAMKLFAELINAVDDLDACLVENRMSIPFITSDNPAIMTNRAYLSMATVRKRSFGVSSGGLLAILPISPRVLFLGYDKEVYSVQTRRGWADLRKSRDAWSFNEFQVLDSTANLYLKGTAGGTDLEPLITRAAMRRIERKYEVHYAVRDDGESAGVDGIRYRVVDKEQTKQQEHLVHLEAKYSVPESWPRQIEMRQEAAWFSDGSAAGYLRRAWIPPERRSLFRRLRLSEM